MLSVRSRTLCKMWAWLFPSVRKRAFVKKYFFSMCNVYTHVQYVIRRSQCYLMWLYYVSFRTDFHDVSLFKLDRIQEKWWFFNYILRGRPLFSLQFRNINQQQKKAFWKLHIVSFWSSYTFEEACELLGRQPDVLLGFLENFFHCDLFRNCSSPLGKGMQIRFVPIKKCCNCCDMCCNEFLWKWTLLFWI